MTLLCSGTEWCSVLAFNSRAKQNVCSSFPQPCNLTIWNEHCSIEDTGFAQQFILSFRRKPRNSQCLLWIVIGFQGLVCVSGSIYLGTYASSQGPLQSQQSVFYQTIEEILSNLRPLLVGLCFFLSHTAHTACLWVISWNYFTLGCLLTTSAWVCTSLLCLLGAICKCEPFNVSSHI